VADHLIRQLALRSDATERDDRSGLTPTRVVRERGLVVIGYEGGDAESHCAHLRLLPELVRRAVGE
jgi:hypothetical protein